MYSTRLKFHAWSSMRYIWKNSYARALALAGVLFVGLGSIPAQAVVNVYFSAIAPASLQTDLIAGLTNQWNGTFVASQFQPGTYLFTVTSKKPIPPPAGCPACLVDVSSVPFTYGYVFGEGDCRTTDLGIVNKYLTGCSTSTSCQVGLSSAAVDIYSLINGTPTVVVPPGQ